MSHQKAILIDKDIDRILTRMTHEILEAHKGIQNIALIGIHTGGVYLADRIQTKISEIEGALVPKGNIDINLYRDDWTRIAHQPVIQKTDIPFSIDDKKAVLVDDVLFTGRTVRAAMDVLIDFGRPKRIELAVLIDRGHRELPIQADFVGKHIPTIYDTTVNVYLKELSGRDEVIINGL
ncbi:MAG: bifunctional pyr operon transcriptional regulator/uracil phosphoribosyltransferase PyrR [Desulfobacterales bacterium]|nr:bifunctional pyr operon transcriptional regulator/uracil phosphoribosyltransferase PyrR [Desulfobacterales bacterium]